MKPNRFALAPLALAAALTAAGGGALAAPPKGAAAKLPAAAAAASAAASAPTQDRAELERTQIIGNRELPKVLYIVPWKKPLP
ncbi:MAG: hypothetical protein ACXWIG_18500, partial [Caldimonas sp.]